MKHIAKPGPFVPWVGGKTAILDSLLAIVPEGFETYVEPFVGGGAMFFGMPKEGRRVINDANMHLMNAYIQVKDDVEAVIEELEKLIAPDSLIAYKELAQKSVNTPNGPEGAALFIATLKTSWGAKWEIDAKGNHQGGWIGKKRNICDKSKLRLAANHLKNTEIFSKDYKLVLDGLNLNPRDFVYLDPPYLPENGQEFTSYTAEGFGEDDHYYLAKWIAKQTQNDVRVMLSMSDTPRAREIYNGLDFRVAVAPRRLNRHDGVGLDLIGLNYYAPG
jgi:DNA adenine methylase